MKYLITSALPYINGVKHLGNLIGSLLPADVYARFLRQQGEEVLYICGTDEHGTPAEIAAQTEGLGIAEYCEKMFAVQSDIYKRFNIDFDYFGRSSSQTNKEVTQANFTELDKNGYIQAKILEQFYSPVDNRFLPDRYVIGTCPKCGFDKARGDQCDQCGQLLNPTDLISPRSAISGSPELEIRKEKHLFLDLKKLTPKLEAWLATRKQWPAFSMSVAKKWLTEGLQSRCISRDLNWGVPIPKPDYENKVFYVWFDAPMAYISITKDWATATGNDWKRWWLEDQEQTCYVQFMAKDNLPFHSIMWPAMLLGTEQNWKTVDILKGFHWLTFEGGKFSTSLNRGIFSDKALELFSADYWRYYLFANIPETSDSDFKMQDFIATINKDLVGTLGNFANRVAALVNKYFDNGVPEYQKDNEYIVLLKPKVEELIGEINKDFYALNFRSAMRRLRELWTLGNEFITEAAPWTLIKTDTYKAGEVLAACLHLLRIYSFVSFPVIPESAQKLYSYLGGDEKLALPAEVIQFDYLPVGKKLGTMELLFEKISSEKQEFLMQNFSVQVG